jgi:GNAT superfamily N-acetyltransferase
VQARGLAGASHGDGRCAGPCAGPVTVTMAGGGGEPTVAHDEPDGAFSIRTMSQADLDLVLDWAAAEGWNPGLGDAACFHAADPGGFLLGELDGTPITSISLVRYDDGFAFLGFYIARPELRGRGFGYATWRAALELAGDRAVGLDGVVAQQDNYAREGFRLAHRNVRYGGAPDLRGLSPRPPGLEVVAAAEVAWDDLVAYDRRCFQSPRPAFLAPWCRAEGHVARAAVRGGELCGYAVLRACREGAKIGPLFADDAAVAEALVAALAEAAPAGPVYLDPPGCNGAAVALAERLGLQPVFETARMYRGAPPAVDLDRVFGITTFELG